jgi:poly-beta-1,6-N-acetyl-D-glucosamine synthase
VVAILFFILFGVYFLLLVMLRWGWKKAITVQPPAVGQHHFISVIIPVRNESENIGTLLDDLLAQHYPSNSFEIIVVNDHSNDNTLEKVEEKAQGLSLSRITIVTSAAIGKKAALTEGIRVAKGKIIVTTDADCRMGNGWLASINQSFQSSAVKMVLGTVKIENDGSLFSRMQSLEFASLIGSGAATLALGNPTFCNGANLAFRKAVFEEVRGYDGNSHVASGDDEFLLRKVFAAYPTGIQFNANPENRVATRAQPSLASFFQQRLRWAGKWNRHREMLSKFLALYIFLFHVSVLVLPWITALNVISFYSLISLLLIKAILEYRFLSKVTFWLNQSWHWPSFILLQVLYSFYAVTVGGLSNFVKPKWRGRIVS